MTRWCEYYFIRWQFAKGTKIQKELSVKKTETIWEPACPIYFWYSLIKWHPVIEKDIVSIKRGLIEKGHFKN